MKNIHPSHLINKKIRKIFGSKFTTKENTNIVHNNISISYYKLPYTGSYSNSTKKKIYELCKTFCKNTNDKIVSPLFKLHSLFSSKYCLPVVLKSFVVYKLTCAGCQSSYTGEAKLYLPTRMK